MSDETTTTWAKKDIIAVAEDLNEICKLKPAIQTAGKRATVSNLLAEIKEVATEEGNIQPTDALSEQTWKFLEEQGWGPERDTAEGAAPKPKKKRSSTKYTRYHAFCDALREGGTIDELVAVYKKHYEEKSGNKCAKDASTAWVIRDCLKPLIIFGFAREVDGRFELAVDEPNKTD